MTAGPPGQPERASNRMTVGMSRPTTISTAMLIVHRATAKDAPRTGISQTSTRLAPSGDQAVR